jgi:hypothetical protein
MDQLVHSEMAGVSEELEETYPMATLTTTNLHDMISDQTQAASKQSRLRK